MSYDTTASSLTPQRDVKLHKAFSKELGVLLPEQDGQLIDDDGFI